jgi:biotin synthase-related radical SAM superfamily protein
LTVKRNITKEDIFLKARILSEGIRMKVKKQPEKGIPFRPFVLDGCDLVVRPLPNQYSRLEAVIDGDDVTISDMGKVLSTGKLEVYRSWRDEIMSHGKPADNLFMLSGSSASIINIILNFRCYNYDSGQGCKYCGLFARSISKDIPVSVTQTYTAHQVEMAVIAAQNGWRGTLAISGGAFPPSQRGQMVDNLERIMTQFRESLDEKILSQLHIGANVYPPDDFEEMHKWKELGVNAAEFDIEVMDPAYFKAICPGKSKSYSQKRWKEAQEAAVEIFGRGRGVYQSLVTGIEPMNSLVEGVEERISKGVYSAPLIFAPTPGTPYAEFRPPTAKWFVEANEKMADIYFRYADSLDVNLLTDNRPGFTRMGLSYPLIILRDEMARRLQEQGKFPPGLPSQDFIE